MPLLLLLGAIVIALNGCGGPGLFKTVAAPGTETSWERTNALRDKARTETFDDGPMKWTLTTEKAADERVCWTARIVSGPPVLSSISEIGDFCTVELDESAPVVQFPFAQASQTMFAEEDGRQTIAGVADDRLDRVRFASTDGRMVPADIGPDGTFVASLPLGFHVDSVVIEGDDLRVDCEGGMLEDLERCSRHPKG